MASSDSPPVHYWSLPFLQLASPPRDESQDPKLTKKTALIILNQPFSKRLLHRLWHASDWHCCADGGANRLHDLLLLPPAPAPVPVPRPDDAASATITGWIARIASWVFMRPTLRRTEVEDYYLPDLIKGDLDSLREDVRRHYETRVSFCVYILFILIFWPLTPRLLRLPRQRVCRSSRTMTRTPPIS